MLVVFLLSLSSSGSSWRSPNFAEEINSKNEKDRRSMEISIIIRVCSLHGAMKCIA